MNPIISYWNPYGLWLVFQSVISVALAAPASIPANTWLTCKLQLAPDSVVAKY